MSLIASCLQQETPPHSIPQPFFGATIQRFDSATTTLTITSNQWRTPRVTRSPIVTWKQGDRKKGDAEDRLSELISHSSRNFHQPPTNCTASIIQGKDKKCSGEEFRNGIGGKSALQAARHLYSTPRQQGSYTANREARRRLSNDDTIRHIFRPVIPHRSQTVSRHV